MNNGKINVTSTAVAYDIKASTIITLENTGETDVSVGFGDLDSVFAFGDGVVLNPKDQMNLESTDPRRGDGTFYAVTKNTPNTQNGVLSFFSDGGVAPALLIKELIPGKFAENVAVNVVPSIKFSANIDDGVPYHLGLFDSNLLLVPGTLSVVDDTISYTPTNNLDSNGYYTLTRMVFDFNGKINSGVTTFTVVIV